MMHSLGRVAQLDRVSASEAEGRGFESRLVHQMVVLTSPVRFGNALRDFLFSLILLGFSLYNPLLKSVKVL